MRAWLKISLVLLALVCAGAGYIGYEIYRFLDTPPNPSGSQVMFDVRPGTSLQGIATALQEQGLVRDARKFTWLARYKRLGDKLQSGRFALNTGWKPGQILDTLAFGKPVLYRVTIPEGMTWWQTGQILEAAGLARQEDFREVVNDPAFLRHYGIPFASAEGFLMPDTYLVHKPDSPMPTGKPKNDDPADAAVREEWRAQARSVAGRMVDNFWRKTATIWPVQAGSTGQSRPKRDDLKKWVTLASIVEKETGIDAERKRVAGVYANRISRNMLLQADPTVSYGLGPQFTGALKRSDLENTSNPYNTYQRPGLPPGPISSFGLAALKAAINPERHDYLYFVAKTDGGEHTFSKSLGEHNTAVKEYRSQKK